MLALVLITSLWILSNANSCPTSPDPCVGVTSATVCCLSSSTNTVTQTTDCYAKCNNNGILPATCGTCCYSSPNNACSNGGTCILPSGTSNTYGYCDTSSSTATSTKAADPTTTTYIDTCVNNGGCRKDDQCANSQTGTECIFSTSGSDPNCGQCGTRPTTTAVNTDPCANYPYGCDPSVGCSVTGQQCLPYTYNNAACYKCQDAPTTTATVTSDPCANYPACTASTGCSAVGYECLDYLVSNTLTCPMCKPCACTAARGCSDTTKTCDLSNTDPSSTGIAKCGVCVDTPTTTAYVDTCISDGGCRKDDECANSQSGTQCIFNAAGSSNPNCGQCGTRPTTTTVNTDPCANYQWVCDPATACSVTGQECLPYIYNGVTCAKCQDTPTTTAYVDTCVNNGGCRKDDQCANSGVSGTECIFNTAGSDPNCGYCGTRPTTTAVNTDPCANYQWGCDPTIGCSVTGQECLPYTYNNAACYKCQDAPTTTAYVDTCINNGGCRKDDQCPTSSSPGTECIFNTAGSNPNCGYCGTRPTTTAVTSDPCANYLTCDASTGCSAAGYECLDYSVSNTLSCPMCKPCPCTAATDCSDTTKTCDLSNANSASTGIAKCGVCVDTPTTTKSGTTAATSTCLGNGGCYYDDQCKNSQSGPNCIFDVNSGTPSSPNCGRCGVQSTTTTSATATAAETTTDACSNACKENKDCYTSTGTNTNYWRKCVADPTGGGGCNVCVDATPTTTDSGTTKDAATTSATTGCPNGGCRIDGDCISSTNLKQKCIKTTSSGTVVDCGTCTDIPATTSKATTSTAAGTTTTADTTCTPNKECDTGYTCEYATGCDTTTAVGTANCVGTCVEDPTYCTVKSSITTCAATTSGTTSNSLTPRKGGCHYDNSASTDGYDSCKWCLCQQVGPEECNLVSKLSELDNTGWEKIFWAFCPVSKYQDLAADVSGAECEWTDLRPKPLSEITGCNCDAFICATNSNYQGSVYDKGDANNYTIMVGIGFVMILFSIM